jgi:serine/threonine protein kinase/Tol biopolymer transport system component
MIGQSLGHYRIEARLGAGGMGVVYRAHDTRLDRPVALKLLGERALLDSTARDDLLREGRAASALNHPNICTVHGVEEADGQTFIVMEYVEGKPLGNVIPTDGLPIELVLRYGTQIAAALEHAHEHGVIHRDLKSANVVVTREGRIKVLDFGLARRLSDHVGDGTTRFSHEPEGTISGTLAYMAPEILRAEPATVASDIWSFGVLLYEMSTRVLPFHGTTGFDLTAAILRGPVPPVPDRVPPAISAIIVRCLAKEPGQRYRRAGELHAALEAVESSVRLAPVPRRASALPLGRWTSAAIVTLSVCGLTLGLLWKRNLLVRPASDGRIGSLSLLESSERRAFDPALSEDGTMVAFVAETASQQLDLFVARVAGGGRVQLTNDPALEGHPRFSPDGERIAFSRRRSTTGVPEVCVIPTLGGDPAVVLVNATDPAWSPDGRRLLFMQRDAPDRLVLATAAVDGSDRRILLRNSGLYPFLGPPAWSPDGKQIAVIRSTGGATGEIWIVPVSGEPPRRLSWDPVTVANDDPAFAPDGRGVIHSSNRGGATNLWLLPLDGSRAVRLTTGPGPDQSPTVARDGTIAFVNSRWRETLLLHDLRSRTTRPLLTHARFLWAPVFSPDNLELAFSRSEVDGSWHIWVTSTSGDGVRRLTSSSSGEVYPRYTPDGKSVVYHTWDGPHRIWRAPRDGGPAVAVTSGKGAGETYADVSPDGQWLAYARADERSEHLYLAPMTGGAERLLTASPGSVPRWSLDGQWIAFSPDRSLAGGILVIRADGTEERRVTDSGGWPMWWPDGKRLGYRALGPEGTQRILTVPLAGGAPVPVDAVRFTASNAPFDVSRDGTQLVTSNSTHVSDEIWLLRPER